MKKDRGRPLENAGARKTVAEKARAIGSVTDARTDLDSPRFRPLTIIAGGTILALLYFAREVFIPLSLAVLLSFLLAIPCAFLERHGFKRSWAVVTVVALGFCLMGGMGWLATTQFYDLARKLPKYHSVIQSKLASLRASPQSTFGKMNAMLKQAAEGKCSFPR